MSPRLASLDGFVRTLAHRGAAAHAPPDTVEAFGLALRLGAGGIATTVWLTADRQPVLHPTGLVGNRWRRRPIGQIDRAHLPEEVPTLDQLYQQAGTGAWLALGIGQAEAFSSVVETATQAGPQALQRLLVRSDDLEQLSGWRAQTEALLVYRSRHPSRGQTPEQLVADLRHRGLDGLELHHSEWSPGLVTLAHRFGCYALATEAEHEREMANMIDIGIDGLSSTHVDRLSATAAGFYPEA